MSSSHAQVFLEFSCFFYEATDVGNLISGSFAFSTLPSYRGKEKNSNHVNKQEKSVATAKTESGVAQNNCFRKDRGKASDWH